MMEGAWQAKTLVTEFLNADLPSRLIRFRNYWEKDDIALPAPEKVIQYEPLAIDHWPTIINLVLGTQDITRDDWDEMDNPKYQVRYAMRTYIWVKAVGFDTVTEIRDNLTTVVRDALVDHPSLRGTPGFEECEAYIDESSIREEFSDLTAIKGDRYMAGAYVAYDLQITETVTRDPLVEGLVLNPSVEVFLLPKVASAPTLLIAQPLDEGASLTWKAPAWDGGQDPIDWYRIEMSTDGGDNWGVLVANTGNKIPAYEVEGLTNGDSYMFRVGAVNSFGLGAMSPSSNSVIPATP